MQSPYLKSAPSRQLRAPHRPDQAIKVRMARLSRREVPFRAARAVAGPAGRGSRRVEGRASRQAQVCNQLVELCTRSQQSGEL